MANVEYIHRPGIGIVGAIVDGMYFVLPRHDISYAYEGSDHRISGVYVDGKYFVVKPMADEKDEKIARLESIIRDVRMALEEIDED